MSTLLCPHDLHRKYAERWETMCALTDDTEFLRQYEVLIREEPNLRQPNRLNHERKT